MIELVVDIHGRHIKLFKGISLAFHDSLSEMLEINLPNVISRISTYQGPAV